MRDAVVPEGTHRLSKRERFDVFGKCAKYQPECSRSGSDRYKICVGLFVGGTLFSSDTMQLYLKFETWVKKQRRLDRVGVLKPWRVWDGLGKKNLPSCYKSKESAKKAAKALNGPHYQRYSVKEMK